MPWIWIPHFHSISLFSHGTSSSSLSSSLLPYWTLWLNKSPFQTAKPTSILSASSHCHSSLMCGLLVPPFFFSFARDGHHLSIHLPAQRLWLTDLLHQINLLSSIGSHRTFSCPRASNQWLTFLVYPCHLIFLFPNLYVSMVSCQWNDAFFIHLCKGGYDPPSTLYPHDIWWFALISCKRVWFHRWISFRNWGKTTETWPIPLIYQLYSNFYTLNHSYDHYYDKFHWFDSLIDHLPQKY